MLRHDRDQHCATGMQIRYVLDGSKFYAWCGRDFPHLTRPDLGTTQPPVTE